MASTSIKLKKDGTPRAKPGPRGGPRIAGGPFKSRGTGKCDSLPIGLCLEVVQTMEKKRWTQKYTAEHFSKLHNIKITQSSISRWAKQKARWMAELERNPHLAYAQRVRDVEYPTLDVAVVSSKDGRITDFFKFSDQRDDTEAAVMSSGSIEVVEVHSDTDMED
ncbi:hypothetical protein PIIN_10106 [Serendipita indica DSM 11827]|uniref:Uncharacterized protein n=1 Tax=Serendipita indica (strain DSM 11827) TaxID=1109443 RepID=G4TXR3_SERID|nr:hypothetical protein PIIN_10106 [Serendipita indica DSM 11827]